nr:exosortase K [uncultured Flavobacterium sp.]
MYNIKTILVINNNIPYYLAAMGLFILLKIGYTIADIDCLIFLLEPTDKFVGLLTSSKSIYLFDKGYYYENLNIIIEKSCSGFNFLLLCFCMLTFLLLKYVWKTLYKVLIIPVSLVLAYILTILANTSRIFSSIIIQNQANNFLPNGSHLLLHESIGIATNLSFLILIYYLLEQLLNKNIKNEKLA